MVNNITKNIGIIKRPSQSYGATVWAPKSKKVELVINGEENPLELKQDEYGYWEAEIKNLKAGSKYMFLLDGELKRPDPASLSQPEGVHGWSAAVDQSDFSWTDHNRTPHQLSEMIIYELHVGTFTPEGTFEAIIDKLDHLLDLGINTIELMPIAQFPGERNWGYDGVFPFAVQHSYGGVAKLKQLVDKCHQSGINIILDVVYNHMGPEGNYLNDFGPYFTDKYHTPWGSALNFDEGYSDHIRNFFLQNAMMWLKDFHFDGLRLDAVHAIMDNGPTHLLKELRQSADDLEKETGKPYVLIAESDMNDVKIISGYETGGYGLQAQWTDDFHHAVHTLITGETDGYYADYGHLKHLAKSFKQGFVYDGIYSEYRKKKVGTEPGEMNKHQFIVCIQNHDQVGNRMLGDRLSTIVSLEKLKLAAGIILISPFVPMLFMGEEYGEDQPFRYFVHHSDPDLIRAVQEGRSREFDSFKWQGEVPDPQSETTFNNSKLNWDFKQEEQKISVFNYYKQLISLRKQGVFSAFGSENIQTEIQEKDNLMIITAGTGSDSVMAVLNFSSKEHPVTMPGKEGNWDKKFASSDVQWLGPNNTSDQAGVGTEVFFPASSITVYQTNQS